ncbi:hypothetical protein [Nocardia sp. NPDC004711]
MTRPGVLLRRRAAAVRARQAEADRRRFRNLESLVDDILDLVAVPTEARVPLVLASAGPVHDGTWTPSAWRCGYRGTFTPDQAHRAMQQHLECLTEACSARATARAVLRESGRMRADSSRPETW